MHIGEVALGRVCPCSLHSRLVFFLLVVMVVNVAVVEIVVVVDLLLVVVLVLKISQALHN